MFDEFKPPWDLGEMTFGIIFIVIPLDTYLSGGFGHPPSPHVRITVGRHHSLHGH
ncbi:hypothetical protein J2129_000700 [Methanofollis sp. W23]|nr:hypothetical protein [Methanofollis sp. W23]